MPIPLFGKLLSATGQPYADASKVEVDASGFSGNLSAGDVTTQLVAKAFDEFEGSEPFVSGVCITLVDGSEVSTVESIDQLTDVPLTLRFNAINSGLLVGGVTLIARRNGAQENISSFTGIVDGINGRTITLTSADITSLRAGTGAIRFNFVGASIELEGVCIAVEPEPLVNVTVAKVFVSAEYYAAQSPTGQTNLLIYEDLNAAEIEMSASGSITLRESEVPVSFNIVIRGMTTTLASAGGVTLQSNFDNPIDGDLLLIVGKGTNFDAFKISNIHDDVSFLDVRYHSLDAGFSGVPTAQTEETLTIVNKNLLSKNYVLAIQGVTVAAFPGVIRGISALKYTITQAQWAQIAGTGSGIYNYSLTNGNDSRIEYATLFRVDL